MLLEGAINKRYDYGRLFPYFLLAITIAALVPVLSLGISGTISDNGYEHLSLSVQKTSELFLARWRGFAHPVLYLLVLRAVVLFGYSKMLCRSASIVPGVAGVYLIGLIAARLYQSRAVALLVAGAYGFSRTMEEIFIDVRSYPLALFFVLAAFYFLIDFLSGDARRNRSLVLFGIFTSLAIASEYYAILFLLACLGTLVLLWAISSKSRERSRAWASRHWRVLIAAFGLPFTVIACFFRIHINYARMMDRLASGGYPSVDFYWRPGLSRIDFVLCNLRADLNYMLPIGLSSAGVVLGGVVVFAPFLLYRGLWSKQSRQSPASGIPDLLSLLLLAELIILSLLRLYPFEGLARQQSILFPFFTLTAFRFLDQLIGWLSRSRRLAWLKAGVLGMTAAAIGANCFGVHSGTAAASWRQGVLSRASPEALPGGTSRRVVKPARTTAGKAGIQWVMITGGTFMMGAGDVGSSALPRHKVKIKSFQMAMTLVTNKQYKACVDAGACTKVDWLGPWFDGDYQPVVGVDWNQAKAFSEWVGGRLPTEAEWEYAARSGGREQKYPWGNEDTTCERAVINADCGYDPTAPVCSKPAGNTQQGLCDMAGNVWEWVQDWYHDTYNGAPIDGSAWESPAGSWRVDRGGCWYNDAGFARSAFRARDVPGNRGDSTLGFRPAR